MNAETGLNVYLVGGAVRDQIMGIPSMDRDYVVVGHTMEEMIARGFRQVGKDFPVFLHPETGEEYALARIERKCGVGYNGFTVDFNPTVTLEEDLSRRDLTINSMAFNMNGELIDPYNGLDDIRTGTLRHTSIAFAEDPLRVLRTARFASRYQFSIADHTFDLMQHIVKSGELNDLTPERVWKEIEKTLGERKPSIFFEELSRCGALSAIMPELEALKGVSQVAQHHPEGDVWTHTMMTLDSAASMSDSIAVRFGALCHDLGKGMTPKELLPRHYDHEAAGVPLVNAICDRYKIPTHIRDIAVMATREHLHIHRIAEMTPKSVMRLFARCDAIRRSNRFADMLLVCKADHYGRKLERDGYAPATIVTKYLHAAKGIDTKRIVADAKSVDRIPEDIRIARIAAIRAARKL